MEKSFKERRQFTRIYRNFILSYHEKGKAASKQDVSQINNISRGGLSFVSTHPIKPKTVVVLKLKTPLIADPINLEGVVLDSKEKISEMIYEVRVQFKDISEPVLNVLEKIENYDKAQDSQP
ncbi:MAG: PilZ domain-containing protein [Candidatus Omnitrophica bacterium]|nr:PilZ domain-containing protein [Candidatus Omnitrophota bacterium]